MPASCKSTSHLDIVGVDVAGFADARAQRLAAQRLYAGGHALVVAVVDDGLGHVRLEQAHLGLEIRIHIAEIVEMILREIRERRHGEAQAAQAVHGQRVGRDFHDHIFNAGVGHALKERLYLDGVGRGQTRGDDFLADHRADRADHARFVPRGFEDGLDEEAGGGLALGAGDADEFQTAGGIAEKLLRHVRQRPAHAFDLHLRAVERQLALHHQRDRALGKRLRRQIVGVCVQAGDAEKQRAGRRPARIDAQRRDLRFRVAGYLYLAGDCPRKRIELHLQNPL